MSFTTNYFSRSADPQFVNARSLRRSATNLLEGDSEKRLTLRRFNHAGDANRFNQSPDRSTQRQSPPLGMMLDPGSDSGVLGDAKTRFDTVHLVGLTSPNATVRLQSGLTTTAGADGRFLFANLPLAIGQTRFTVTAGSGRTFMLKVNRVLADNTDAVLDWNATALRTIQLDRTGGLRAARTLAIAQTAVFDAVNALLGTVRGYRPISVAVPVGASASAAVAGAAYTVLTRFYPEQQSQLDAALTYSLTVIQADDAAEATGLSFGQAVAEQLLSERSQDGADRTGRYKPKLKPGKWRPTPPRNLAATGVAWRNVTPFVLDRGSQLRPDAPPKLNSSTYATELNQVKAVGKIDSDSRTAKQTEIARFWIGSLGTSTAPGMWNEIAARFADQPDHQPDQALLQNARLFARLNLALVDASIAAWDTKYRYRSWRPVTAIRLAKSDKNPETTADPSWQSFLETPAHPDYVSAHSTYAGAASTILTQTFGAEPFTVTSLDLPGVTRSFKTFEQAAAEAGISRIYGGIHTQSANQSGLKLGQKVGSYVLKFV